MIKFFSSGLLLACVLGLAALLAGCETNVDPFTEARRPFTIWGYLEAQADTQFVRVFPIEKRIGMDRSGPIDARVVSTDLTTGEQRVWTDSVITFGPGNVGHVFWSEFRPQSGRRYRLEVSRSDGEMSHAEVRVPAPLEVTLPDSPTDFKIPVRILGEDLNLVGLGVKYVGVPAFPANPWPAGTPSPPAIVFPVKISYFEKLQPISGGLYFQIDMKEDYLAIQEEYQRNCLPKDMVLQRMEFEFLSANDAWTPPGGIFDPEVVVEPGAMSNVENGLGFFGAAQSVSVRWFPPADVLRKAGFASGAPCTMGTGPHCVVLPPCFRCDEALPMEIRQLYCPVGDE